MLQKRDIYLHKFIRHKTYIYLIVKYFALKNKQNSLLLFSFIIFIWLKKKARRDTRNKLHVKSRYYVILMLMRKHTVNVFY